MKDKTFYLSAALTAALITCTVAAFTVGQKLRPGVEQIMARKDYLVFSAEGEGKILNVSAEGEAVVEVLADHQLALQLMGNGAEINGYFLARVPEMKTIWEEEQLYGRILEAQAEEGRYRILVGFSDVGEAAEEAPVHLEVSRHAGPYAVIPETALTEEGEEAFVYEICIKDSMWGEETVLQKKAVTVLARSEGMAAVSGLNTQDAEARGEPVQKIVKDAQGHSEGESVHIQ